MKVNGMGRGHEVAWGVEGLGRVPTGCFPRAPSHSLKWLSLGLFANHALASLLGDLGVKIKLIISLQSSLTIRTNTHPFFPSHIDFPSFLSLGSHRCT